MYYTLGFYCVTITMPGEQPLSIPIKTSSFNWDNDNLYDQWKLFSEQYKFLLINGGPFSKHSEPAHTAAVLSWVGHKSLPGAQQF